VLEPWCEVEVVVPGEYVGAVMSDLSGRRARVTGSDADPERDRTTVRAEIPEVELLGYAGALRSVSHGTGSFTRRPVGYEPAPASLAAVPA
jgi:elongation factor G